jgi:hypothetical protein
VNAEAAVDPLRATHESQAIRSAATALGLTVSDIQPASLGRTGIYRVVIHADHAREGFPAGTSVQASRVTTMKDSIMSARETQRLLWDLSQHGAPVAAPRHRDIVVTAWGEVGFWAWLDQDHVTAHEWGLTTEAFHRAGARIHDRARRYEPGRVFSSRVQRARELTVQRGHPLFGAYSLLRSFESALDQAVEEALAAAERSPRGLVHGDNQPPNLMRSAGRLVLNDFERIVSGPLALDLAALVLGLQHFGYPTSDAAEFLDGYGATAPTLADARPYARIRELSGTVLAMIGAGEGPEMEHEMLVRTASIAEPGGGGPWAFLGNPDAMKLRNVPEPVIDTDRRRPPSLSSDGVTPVRLGTESFRTGG